LHQLSLLDTFSSTGFRWSISLTSPSHDSRVLPSGPPSTWLARTLRHQHIPCANVSLRALVHFTHTAQPPSSCASCFAPEHEPLCACACTMHRSPECRVCTPYPCCLPRAACLAWLYALVHCTGAHPCPSRSALVPLNLSAARHAVPLHMLNSLVHARILPACRGNLGPCARQFPTFGRIRPSPEPIRVPFPSRRACRAIRLHVVLAASAGRATASPRVPRVRSCAVPKPPGRPAPVRDTS
jgi:hypothetical protein